MENTNRFIRSGKTITGRWIAKNPIRNRKIRISQKENLYKDYCTQSKKLIIFLAPGNNCVCGGVISICSIYEETWKLKHIHHAETILCTVPGDPLLQKYTKFKNECTLFEFAKIIDYFTELDELMIHIPECYVKRFVESLTKRQRDRFKRIDKLHFNIMLQNIRLLSQKKYIEELRRIGFVTATTAHEKYTNKAIRTELGMPLHKLSVYVSPEQYQRKKYAEKQNLMIISPDEHARKEEILERLNKELPELKILIISDVPYEEFKRLASEAKWALTFGEGLDGYFVETVFSGGIAFAAYNSEFFTDDFRDLKTVYANYDTMAREIVLDLENLDKPEAFAEYQEREHAICRRYYRYEEYLDNLKRFYEGKYTYP